MEHERNGDILTLRCRRDFNLMAVQHLKYRLKEASHIRIDLSRARLVDTEAIMALDALQREGRTITLLHPPPILEDVLEVLNLRDHFDGDTFTKHPRTSSGIPA